MSDSDGGGVGGELVCTSTPDANLSLSRLEVEYVRTLNVQSERREREHRAWLEERALHAVQIHDLPPSRVAHVVRLDAASFTHSAYEWKSAGSAHGETSSCITIAVQHAKQAYMDLRHRRSEDEEASCVIGVTRASYALASDSAGAPAILVCLDLSCTLNRIEIGAGKAYLGRLARAPLAGVPRASPARARTGRAGSRPAAAIDLKPFQTMPHRGWVIIDELWRNDESAQAEASRSSELAVLSALEQKIVSCEALLRENSILKRKTQRWFRNADLDSNGVLNTLEAQRCISKICDMLHVEATQETVERMLRDFDTDGDGEITEAEFTVFFERLLRTCIGQLRREALQTAHTRVSELLANPSMLQHICRELFVRIDPASRDTLRRTRIVDALALLFRDLALQPDGEMLGQAQAAAKTALIGVADFVPLVTALLNHFRQHLASQLALVEDETGA